MAEIRAERIVAAYETALGPGVGCRNGQAVAVHQVNRIQPRAFGKSRKPLVQKRAVRALQRLHDRRVLRQEKRHMGEVAQLGLDRAAIKRQTRTRLVEFDRLEIGV